MLNLRFISFLILLVAGCSDTQEKTKENYASEKTGHISEDCEFPALKTSASKFLTALNEKDLVTAKSLYFPPSLSSGIEYTFFPENEPSAIFDFKKKSVESPFKIHILGDFNDGQLVAFIQEQHEVLSRDAEFLTYEKFDGYFVCFFQCIEGEWKITRQTCFEDSGGPFFPPEESNLSE